MAPSYITKTQPPQPDLLTTREACQMLHVGKSTLWRWATAGRLHPVRLGPACTRWHRGELLQLIASASTTPDAALPDGWAA